MSTEEIPKKAVRALRTRIQVVRDHLEPLMARPLNETYSKLSMTEKYELQVLLSYTLNTLYYIYLRGNGSDPQKHVVLKELVQQEIKIHERDLIKFCYLATSTTIHSEAKGTSRKRTKA
ncbi:hypothetical protein BCV72DRAFT_212700 [Rhizopus microsporus var. microsporus]|uniref:Exosome complex protein n=1 Tax=Rhizopus microsporus var. microsporus TaxID=86635 RepID=A0A1X0QVE2_RHIZD|nr:hypothetical protein BCV72DRAFT_212700 [Rhizopus microsporus var. microsporus]